MAIRNSAPALENRVLNCDTPPNSQSVIPSISMPSRRACHACASSCRSSETKNSRAATIAIARCTPRERPGFCDGKTPSASDQTIRAKITSQLQLIRTSTPPTRPSVTFPFTIRPFGFAPSPLGIRLRRSAAAAIVLSSSCRRPCVVSRCRRQLELRLRGTRRRRGRHRSLADSLPPADGFLLTRRLL